MEPEISTKILRNLSEKLRAKLPSTTHGCSIVKFAPLDEAFSEVFELDKSPVEGQSLQQKGKTKGGKGKAQKNEKEEEVGHFLIQKSQTFIFCMCQSKNVVKHGA